MTPVPLSPPPPCAASMETIEGAAAVYTSAGVGGLVGLGVGRGDGTALGVATRPALYATTTVSARTASTAAATATPRDLPMSRT
jgi:hypothetical protein